MPALLCSTSLAEPFALPSDTKSSCKKLHRAQLQRPRLLDPLDLPEICDQIARHLDRHTLTIVIRVSTQWYAHWIRHLWRRVRIESGTIMVDKSRNMLAGFHKLSQHIRHLEWTHLSSTLTNFTPDSIFDWIDFSNLNAQTIHLSNWTNELDAPTLTRFTQSSSGRLTSLWLYNMAQVRGDLLKVVGTLPALRHFTLSMADQDSHRHHRQRSNASSASSVSSQVSSLSEKRIDEKIEEVQFTSANSLSEIFNTCPQLRVIEILDLPQSTPTVSVSIGVTGNDGDNEEQELEQEQEQRESVKPLKNITPNWVPMQHLTVINLHATAILGSTLTMLFARCPQLIKLNLGQNSPLFLSEFTVNSSLTMATLSTLILSGCHFLDGHGYKEIFKASPNLVHLDIPQTNVDDAALAVLGHQCLKLTELSLDGCHHITDQGIRDMLSRPRSSSTDFNNSEAPLPLEKYQNFQLQCLSISNCTELTGQGIHHILMTCGRLKNLEFQQPEIMPESLFPHILETDDEQENPSAPSSIANSITQEESTMTTATVYPTPGTADTPTASTITTSSDSWACHGTLERLRIKNLNVINRDQSQFLNERLRELTHLKVLHIGGSQLELSILNGLGHQLENLYIDDLAREVDVNDVKWLVDHTPNLTRLWCRQLIRHSEPWKILRAAREHVKLW
ncbi:hypothetical protein FBU30_008941 [Linnemannia zychae]|nr:hypothetical protein FBU30_008941 [Linnemannia zychae]